jgi:MFS transporter, MHS family, alpha-ketoglutarate permease
MSRFVQTHAGANGSHAGARARTPWRKVIVGAGAGNALEWYDWSAYAVFAPFFAAQFFNANDPVAALLGTLAVFAVGFFMRPVGGLFFGWLADRRGRQTAMVVAMGVTALGSLLIAVAPTYGSIGVAASLLLLLARLTQGFGLGGEVGASHTFLAESAPPKRRGLWCSTMYIAITVGVLVATLQAVLLTSVLTESEMQGWGWRVPFIVGTLLGFYALYLRRGLPETPAYEQQRSADRYTASRPPLLRSIWRNRAAAARVIGLTVGSTVAYYTWAISAPGYAINVHGIDARSALWASVIANLVFIAALPAWGAFSDRFGRKANAIVGPVALILLSFPLNRLIEDQAWQLAVAMSVALFFLAAIASIAPALFAELFPTHVRASGTAVPYSIAVALFGGTAPYLMTWLADRGTADLFIVYTIVMLAVSVVTIAITPESKGRSLETPVAEPTPAVRVAAPAVLEMSR